MLLTCDDVEVSIFGFVVTVLRVLAAVLVDDRLVLDELVLLAEADVAVGVQLGDVTREVLVVHGVASLAGDGNWRFKVDVRRRLRLVGVVQVVVVGVEAFSRRFKGSEERFKRRSKKLSHVVNE